MVATQTCGHNYVLMYVIRGETLQQRNADQNHSNSTSRLSEQPPSNRPQATKAGDRAGGARLLLGTRTAAATVENSAEVSYKVLNRRSPYNLAVPLLGVCPEKTIQKDTRSPALTSALLAAAKNGSS